MTAPSGNHAGQDWVRIFDTTLRDGEQSPGCTMNVEEKIAIAQQLEALGVDVIEAGFAASSQGDFDANRKVIYVYSKNWADETDVMRVREVLRTVGFIERIGYKRNIETFAGEYAKKGKRVTYYSA